jgi:polyphenol oxidase
LKRCQVNSLVYYQFQELTSQVALRHGVFTRLGGVSRSPFDTLNLGRSVGDSEEAVEENYTRICRALGIARDSLVTGYQTHSDNIAVVGSGDVGRLFPSTDALITDCAEVSLVLRFADCVPLLFFDPTHRVIGLAHAGWKGTVDGIGAKVVRLLQERFGSRPSELIACIGPSIGPCCYEVGSDVTELVRDAFPAAEDLLVPQSNQSVHFDLWAANRLQLQESGLTRVEEARVCTACHCDEFFSHRGNHHTTGRFGVFMSLAR